MSEKSEQIFEEKWQLPEKFRLTDELLEKSDAEQSELRDLYKLENSSPVSAERKRALAQISDLLNIENPTDAQKSQLAESYAVLGRFDKACEIAPTAFEQNDYADIWIAVHRDESEWCAHPKSARYAEKDVFSVELDAEAILYRCNTCRFRNVAPIDAELAGQRAKRKIAREQNR